MSENYEMKIDAKNFTFKREINEKNIIDTLRKLNLLANSTGYMIYNSTYFYVYDSQKMKLCEFESIGDNIELDINFFNALISCYEGLHSGDSTK